MNTDLAQKLYELCLDMDFMDYEENKEREISCLIKELNDLKAPYLLKCLKIITGID